VVRGDLGAGRGQQQEPQVVVHVERTVGVGHVVDVEIDGRQHRAQVDEPGLLLGLPTGGGQEVAVAVDVATGLEPAGQLAVVEDQDAAGGVDHHRRRGEVVGQGGPLERVDRAVAELEHPPAHGVELGVELRLDDQRPGSAPVTGTR
jgi:hypothetical protein